jgi:hypothetical protein
MHIRQQIEMFAKQYSDFLKQKYAKGGPLSSSVLHLLTDS